MICRETSRRNPDAILSRGCSQGGKVNEMQNVQQARKVAPLAWVKALASLLPLWLLALAIMAEGFPRPPISIQLAAALFVIAIALSSVLFWKRWTTVELVLYSLIPFALLITFDEISTAYKSPFILLCALILTAGWVGYQRTRLAWLRWGILVSAALVTLLAASHAADSFWRMAGDWGYHECFPDYQGCAPLTGQETRWWTLFFSA